MPIEISLSGIADAISILQEFIVPWRREHSKKLAELELAEVAKANANKTLERQTLDANESDKIQKEILELAASQELQRKKLQIEQMKLALEIIEKINPDLSEEQKLLYSMKLLAPLETLIESPLILETVTDLDEDSKEEIKSEDNAA